MGSSKKKKEKKKDFVKQKLKVGKVTKNANATDTSFKSKTISLPNQQIGTKDLSSYIALTKHHSSSTRKEVLLHLTKNLPHDAQLLKKIIQSIIPLINDESNDVRKQLYQLFEKLCQDQLSLVKLNDKNIILFIHSSMNHLNPSIKHYSINFLNLVITYFPENLINLYFTKTMESLITLLKHKKPETIQIFKKFITVSLQESQDSQIKYHPLTDHYFTIREFSALNLFHNQNLSTDLNSRKQIILDKMPVIDDLKIDGLKLSI